MPETGNVIQKKKGFIQLTVLKISKALELVLDAAQDTS